MNGHPQIITSPRAALRIEHARAWLQSQRPDSEILLVAANWEAADDLVRSLAASRGALLGIHRLTLNRLIGLLAAGELAARGLVPLSPLAAEAVAARAIHKLYSPTGPERSAGSSSDSPDFFSEVV